MDHGPVWHCKQFLTTAWVMKAIVGSSITVLSVVSIEQEPKARPSAKYLLQHKFVVGPRPSLAAVALLPLIARSRDALQAMAAASDPLVVPPSSR